MSIDMKKIPEAVKLAELIYLKLKCSKDGTLTTNELYDLFDSKPEYGLRRVNSGAVQIMRSRQDVEEFSEKGLICYRLKESQ